MRTGELAAHAGVNVRTVRFYERRGILPKPGRTSSGYRVYSTEAVRLIRFIKRAQELGFTLDELEELLRLRSDRRASCSAVKAAGEAKMTAVDAKIGSLKAMKRALAVLLASCDRNDRDRECPILEALEVRTSDRPGRRALTLYQVQGPGFWGSCWSSCSTSRIVRTSKRPAERWHRQ
jgi:MerR family mercuric resistance operon transcriptional regulator